jgi:hypothetical protein
MTTREPASGRQGSFPRERREADLWSRRSGAVDDRQPREIRGSVDDRR